jgi:hypothetical protein
MKTNWLRGLLLGVSVALLLGGGVALAQGLFLTVDKPCVLCWPGEGEPAPTQTQYLLGFTIGGFDPSRPIWFLVTIDGELYMGPIASLPPSEDPSSGTESFPCEWRENGPMNTLVLGGDATIANGEPGPLGEWVYRIWQELPEDPNPTAEATWVVARDCSAYEFVPEPGSILLLGSGLAGLAGYAALRWRTRE